MIRRVLLGVVLVLVAGTAPAYADDTDPTDPPVLTPPPIPVPSDIPSPGPTYVITPGVGGTELPAPADKKAFEKAVKADRERAKQSAGAGTSTHRGHAGAKTGTPSGDGRTEVAGPQAPLVAPAALPAEKVALPLRGFAALVAALVLFEVTAVRRYVFRRRRAAAA